MWNSNKLRAFTFLTENTDDHVKIICYHVSNSSLNQLWKIIDLEIDGGSKDWVWVIRMKNNNSNVSSACYLLKEFEEIVFLVMIKVKVMVLVIFMIVNSQWCDDGVV